MPTCSSHEPGVLIIGGYGVFGGRLVALLEDEPRLTLIVAGRSLQRRFHFHVEIRHALTGLIVRYRGSLANPTPR